MWTNGSVERDRHFKLKEEKSQREKAKKESLESERWFGANISDKPKSGFAVGPL